LPEAAERAGYRACQRCRPKEAAADDPARERVRRACLLIDTALEEGENGVPSLAALGTALAMSPFHLQRLFKRHLGISPREYADARRLDRVKARLADGEDVSGALYGAGYGSSSRLYERAGAQLGMTPATYRKGGAGAVISYASAPTPLGRLLVAATEKGICAVTLGATEASLAADLKAQYAAAEIKHEQKQLGPWLEALVAHLEGKLPDLHLPLDLRATSFQWRVWRELQQIPYGTTTTYRDIARRIGEPNSIRAVARACASNRAALVIPCHRVLRADGDLAGYRWGIARKAKLLDREKRKAAR
jgi:AraC family transcriptional regulator of adaptative response/methylated-DNA-[protein]-cysteine methyltransferase